MTENVSVILHWNTDYAEIPRKELPNVVKLSYEPMVSAIENWRNGTICFNITGHTIEYLLKNYPELIDRIKALVKENVVLAGDAAGMVNPIFYGGIRIGMTSGKLAGQVASEYLEANQKNKEYSTEIYYKYLKEYHFMKEVNLKCHDFFYSRSNLYLTKIGKAFDRKSINEITGLEKLKVLGNILKTPSLLKYPRGLLQIYRGFKIARDWGF